jgi:hypothetical protein
VKGRGKRRIYEVRCGSRPLKEEHQHLSMAERGSLVNDGISRVIIKLSLLEFFSRLLLVGIKIVGDLFLVVELNSMPKFLMLQPLYIIIHHIFIFHIFLFLVTLQ